MVENPLSWRLKLGYAAGQLVEGVVNNTLTIFLLFYLTAVCGLSGGLAGVALSIGIVVDAVMDPLIGALSDRWQSRLGRRLPFMLAGLPPLALCLVLIFTLPSSLAPPLLFAWLTLLSVVLRIALSMFVLPFQAVGAELSADHAERSSVMAWRWGLGMVGAVVAVMLGFGVFFTGPGGLSQRSAYPPFALALAAILLFGGLVGARTTYLARARLHHRPEETGGDGLALYAEFFGVFRSHSFRILFTGALLFFVALGTNTALGLHINTYFWRLSEPQIQLVTLALLGGLLAGAPLAGPFVKRLEKRTILAIGMTGLLLATGGPTTLRLLGLLPLEGDSLAALLAAIGFGGGVLMAVAGIAFSAMMADATDEYEHLSGKRREGLFFAGWAFASKAAQGGGALIAGGVLDLVRFPANLAQQGGAEAALPVAMIDRLAIAYGPGSALLFLASVGICLFYRLDRRRHAAILVELTERRHGVDQAAREVA